MEKNVKKLAEIVDEIVTKYDWDEDFALHLVALVAGGENMIADWLEEYVNECNCDDEDCNCPDCADDDDEDDWDEEDVKDNTVMNDFRTVGAGNRLIIPTQMFNEAEKINGSLETKKNGFGSLTLTRYDDHILVEFGNKTKKREIEFNVISSKIIHLNDNGQLQFRATPVFEAGDEVQLTLQKDGAILVEEA